MQALLLIGVGAVLAFGFVVLFGPPYLPTMKKETDAALDMLGLKPGQTVLDLGSGDGRVLRAAAKRGLNACGIELNPFLVIFSRLYNWRYRSQICVIWGSYWKAPWPQADAIFTFMLGRYMGRLDEKIEKWHKKPIRLASFAFTVPGKKPTQIKHGVYLYEYK
jgi:hypothetical protein